MNARELALKTLYDVFYKDAYSNLALKKTLSSNNALSAADKSLMTNLVYGVVSRHFTLEYVIGRYSKLKLKKISDYIKLILEMGIYQLMYTDRIPAHAAVNESVLLAKKYGRPGTDRFVNGVLRAFCRDGCAVTYPQTGTDRLAVRYSFSTEMTRLFQDNFGDERAERIMDALNDAPPLILRANILKNSAEELIKMLEDAGIKSELIGCALIRAEGFDVGGSDIYRSGRFSVQDQGAYNAALVLDPEPGCSVLDMCAAPGGKSAHAAELMGDRGSISAYDIHPHKIELIEETARRLGLHSITAGLSDAAVYNDALAGRFDRVLCDVPCSGLGIIRRKPDIKLGRNDISGLYDLQRRILDNGAEYAKPGGKLVYSTCTINKAENEGIIGGFLERHGNFEKTYEKTFYPDTDGTDGFYVCRLEKIQ